HPERIDQLHARMVKAHRRAVAGALRGMAARPDRSGELGKIAVPTLVLVGEDDAITPPAEAKAMAGAIPDARLEVIPEAGHMAPVETPGATNRALLTFLNGLG